MLTLQFPNISHKKERQDTIKEFQDAEEKITPAAMDTKELSYEEFLKNIELQREGKYKPELYVAATLYFLVNEENRILGAVHIRHTLNEFLKNFGGHIGYGIRPSERRKGYATLTLKLALEKCKEIGIEDVILTCNSDNIGSAKTIQNNNGILIEEYICKENENKPTKKWKITI